MHTITLSLQLTLKLNSYFWRIQLLLLLHKTIFPILKIGTYHRQGKEGKVHRMSEYRPMQYRDLVMGLQEKNLGVGVASQARASYLGLVASYDMHWKVM